MDVKTLNRLHNRLVKPALGSPIGTFLPTLHQAHADSRVGVSLTRAWRVVSTPRHPPRAGRRRAGRTTAASQLRPPRAGTSPPDHPQRHQRHSRSSGAPGAPPSRSPAEWHRHDAPRGRWYTGSCPRSSARSRHTRHSPGSGTCSHAGHTRHSAALIRLLVSIATHQHTINEDLREFNRQQIAINERLERLLARMIPPSPNGHEV